MLLVYIGVTARSLLVLTSIYFTYRTVQLYQKFPRRSVGIVAVIYSTIVVGGIIQVAVYAEGVEVATTTNSNIDGYIGVFFVYLLILLTSYYEDINANSIKILFATSFATLVILSISLTASLQELSDEFLLLTLTFIPYFLWGTYSIYRALRRMETNMSGKQLDVVRLVKIFLVVGILGISAFYAFFAISLGALGDVGFLDYTYFLLQPIVPSLLFIIANYLFYISIIRPQNPSLLQPHHAEKFILMTKEGTPAVEYDFKDSVSIDGVLLSGALTAISAVLKEATQVAGDLESIRIGDKTILVSAMGDMIGVLFTQKLSNFTVEAMDQTMNEISQLTIDPSHMKGELIEEINAVIETNFGY